MIRILVRGLVVGLLGASHGGAAGSIACAIVADEPVHARGAMRVVIETIAVDGRGTNSVAQDEADIFPGQSGVLAKKVLLRAREGGDYAEEEVHLETRISLGGDAEPFCPLLLSIVASGRPRGAAPSAEADRRALSLDLQAGETRMIQAYLSPYTAGRLVLRVTCGAAVPAVLSEAPRSIEFDLSLERGEDDAAPRLLRTDRLSTTLQGEAGSLFSSHVPLPDGPEGKRRYRRERLEVQLSPRILSGGRLEVEVRLQGEVATLSTLDPPERYPIDLTRTVVLASGRTEELELSIDASHEAEGWSRVRFRLRVAGRF